MRKQKSQIKSFGFMLVLTILLISIFVLLIFFKFDNNYFRILISSDETENVILNIPTDLTHDNCVSLPHTYTNEVNHLYQDVRGGLICRYKIHPTLDDFIFELVATSNINRIDLINIYELNQPTIIQTDRTKMQSEPPLNLPLLKIEDINYDGYGDLAIFSSWDANGNIIYTYWLFDIDTKKFIKHENLSKLPNIKSIFSNRHFMSTSYQSSDKCLYTEQIYAILPDTTLLLLHEEKQYKTSNNDSLMKHTKTLQGENYLNSSTIGTCAS